MTRPATRVAFVGQAPGRRFGRRLAFEGPTGDRLARACGLESHQELRERALLINLWGRYPGPSGRVQGDGFVSAAAARAAARRRARLLASRGCEIVVCCGRAVATGFGLGDRPFLSWGELQLRRGVLARVAVVPHPSGVSRWWNDPAARRRASNFLQQLLTS